ncbi:hypothetical protein BO79DRAFT_285249 [Aspergillus costaricaensis CBS 115574]|uniref:Uncharacterized protein n=1 Tax=Aspergillus costaricaensis CBS 115574 TaxID=1448317 RepID=A0ACD1IRI8_9EURO|nr:hypothetical protein BO79DRAFT_285249 [Aspergillus costaricaensis CBS 115574]RAK92284.1 hypothetical protein BO79DRAFT_285249 [Aspergillus costaricaensis CBS 115574]
MHEMGDRSSRVPHYNHIIQGHIRNGHCSFSAALSVSRLSQSKELNLSHLNVSSTLILHFLGNYAIPTVPIAESSKIQRLRPSTVPSVPIISRLRQPLIPRPLSDYAEAIEQNKTGKFDAVMRFTHSRQLTFVCSL